MKKILLLMTIGISLFSCGKVGEISENIKETKIVENIQKPNKNNEIIKAKVIKVYDGDTVTLENKIRIRLYGIDAPELKQKGGQESRDTLANIILNKVIEVEVINTDRYGRKVGKLYYNGQYLNLMMVEKGQAHYYEEYAKNELEFAKAYENAKKNKLGMFKNGNIQMPSEFRKNNKRKN